MSWETISLYAMAAAAISRAAGGLLLHALSRPGRPARLRRDGTLRSA